MIRFDQFAAQQQDDAPVTTAEAPRLWSLSARQLHDAFWHAHGVQCIRRGTRQPWQRGAELFLLLEPDQLVTFNVGELSDRLTWHNAAVTRLRLSDDPETNYSEYVVTDDRGFVQCIERRYRPRSQGSTRVILTPSRRIARLWMGAANRREGWDRARRAVPWSRVDHCKCPGATFIDGDAEQESSFIRSLVARWSDPGVGIAGIVDSGNGVWHVRGQRIDADAVRIGPLWLGMTPDQTTNEQRCLVGPAWISDQVPEPAEPSTGVSVRDIIDVELADRPRNERTPEPGTIYTTSKRIMDITISLCGLLCLWPAMMLIGTLILLEDGTPILYGQWRQGRGSRRFRCWKFRTMLRNADQLVQTLEAQNLADGPQIFIQNDPRVTRIGHFLRASHLDELPQLLNVLIGQMSLVGPRPSPDDENQFCPAWRDVRLSVRPGITGLWQLNRTREPGEDFQEWIKYDIEYVQRASLTLDVSIMVRTLWAILFGRSERAAD